MPGSIFILEAANIFCGDQDPSLSQHLTITDHKLPKMELATVDHSAGGAPMTIEIDTILQKLESTFTLAGWSPEVATLIASWEQQHNTFTSYGVIRDRRSGIAIEAKAIIGGKLGLADPANFTRGAAQSWAYAIRAITSYQLYVDQAEVYWWDFFLNTLRVGGVDRTEERNRILRIPTFAAA